MNMKNQTLVLTVKAKGKPEAIDRFLDVLEELPNLELHGDYSHLKTEDGHGLEYSSSIIIVVRPDVENCGGENEFKNCPH